MTTLAWLIRREVWENKAIWAMPLIVGALLILAALFGDVDLNPGAALLPPDQPRVCGALVLFGYGIVLFFVMSVYSIWYLLDSLYIDRKDRSVLFWSALPISDTAVVLSKLVTGLMAIPLATFVVADATIAGMVLAVTFRGPSATSDVVWQPQNWIQLQVLWLYLIGTMAIWYLPVAAWILFVSAWARKSVLLWAAMPVLVPYLIERWILRTHIIGTLVNDRLAGFVHHAFHNNADEVFAFANIVEKGKSLTQPAARTVWELIDMSGFFSTHATWIGFAVGALFVGGAVELRRRHGLSVHLMSRAPLAFKSRMTG